MSCALVPADLEPRELRTLESYKSWKAEITPQPQFGAALSEWMADSGLTPVMLAPLVGCKPETVRNWCKGAVPAKEGRAGLRAAGFRGDFHPLKWQQSQFVRAELVQVKNKFWRPGDFEGREFIEKYAVTCNVTTTEASGRGKERVVQDVTRLVDFVFPDRVSDVIATLSKGDAISDWVACQALNHALGELVMTGTYWENGVLLSFELRGCTWRKIKAWQRKAHTWQLNIDHSKSHVGHWSTHSSDELLSFHEQAFNDRYRTRDRAGELGTRAHKLGHAWLKFHKYQPRDENGRARVHHIVFPAWFWYWHKGERGSNLLQFDLAEEPIEVQQALTALETFFAANELEIVSCEELLADLTWGVAGAADCLVRDFNGDLILLDWKTSNGVYSSMFLQVAWYARLYWLCRGEMPARSYIVRLDKTTAAVQVVPVWETPEQRKVMLEAALMAAHLYRWNQAAERHLDDIKAKANKAAKEANQALPFGDSNAITGEIMEDEWQI